MVDGQTIITSGTLLALIVFVLKNNKDNRDSVSRVYNRLDEVKKNNDEKYTNRQVCDVKHEQLLRDVTEIKLDVKLLLRNGKRKGG